MKIIAAILFVFGLASGITAQSPTKIISQANKALGGEKALKTVNSWQQEGKITRLSDGATGRFCSMSSSGGLYAGMYDLNGFEVAFGYNGKSGWLRDSKTGLRTITGDAAREFQAQAAYRNTRWLKAKDEKSRLTSGGTSQVGGKPANVVLLTTDKAVRLKLYFDAETGILLREDIPNGGKIISFEYSDYRNIGGIQTPLAIKFSEPDETYEITLDEVKYNQEIERSLFDFPKVSNEALPDISSLLVEIRTNAGRIDEIRENYSYTETSIDRDVNSNGDFVIKGSEKRLFTFYKGYRITRTLEKNNKPLSASDQAKEDKNVEKQIAEIEKKIAEKERRQSEKREVSPGVAGEPREEDQRFTIADALKGGLLINPRRERFRGRDVIVFDYEPNPNFKPKTGREKFFALCSGAAWVDDTTKQIVRLEAGLTKNMGNFLATARRGASFSIENEFVNNEIWLPSHADVNIQIKILFGGIRINNLIKYGDYRRFETEVKGVTVGEEKKP